jgi:hypothetical protein
MDEQRRNSIIAKAYKLIETPIEPYVPPPSRGWTPRHVEPPTEPEPAVARRSTDSMIAREVEFLRAQVALHQKKFASVSTALDALADEAGGECGRLQRQVRELQEEQKAALAVIEEMRGEIALLRALQPQKLLSRKSVPKIEGPLGGHAAVN